MMSGDTTDTSVARESDTTETFCLDPRGSVSVAIRLHEYLLRSITVFPDSDISIDCSQVQHLSAAILQILVAADAELKRHKRMVRLEDLSSNAIQQIKRAGITSHQLQWLAIGSLN